MILSRLSRLITIWHVSFNLITNILLTESCCLKASHCTEVVPLAELQITFPMIFISVALRPNAGHGLLILEVSRPHTTTHHSR
jgi:hypothetical protein